MKFLAADRIRVKGFVNDICPNDSFKASLKIQISFGDSTRDRRIEVPGKCRAGGRNFRYKTRHFGRAIEQVAVVAQEIRYKQGIPYSYGDQEGIIIYQPYGDVGPTS